MCFELGDRQVVLRTTFRTADPHRILKHIHLPNRQGGSMGAQTGLDVPRAHPAAQALIQAKEESPVDFCLVIAPVVTRCTMRQELHVSTTMRSGSTRLTVAEPFSNNVGR